VDLLPTPEQLEIVSTAAAVLAQEFPISRVQAARNQASSVDGQAWTKCAELGWFGLDLPEELGGVGYALVEAALLFREIGRALAPGPFFASTLGARVAGIGGRPELSAAVMAGDAIVGLAEPRGPDASVGEVVNGTFDLIDAVGASHVLAVSPACAALLPIEAVEGIETLPCIDPAVRLGRGELQESKAVAHVSGEEDPVFARGSVLAAAMLVGIAEATRDRAVEHAKSRIQFGVPIGAHQAVKHRCADMATRTEAAHEQLLFAALTIDEHGPDAAFQAAAAKVLATDAAITNGADNIQVHGGMGYTFESDAHLFLKRAHVLDRVGGHSRQHLARLVDLPAVQ
jgi:alkylation response protein AidB-like acyl-CoA dehydrogenase